MTFYEAQLWKINKTFPSAQVAELILRAKMYMEQNCGKDLTLDRLATEACMSKFHFVRVFRKFYGRTPYQYLTTIRMQKAARALKANASVIDACLEAGFDSTTTFARRFRMSAGAAPSQFARRRSKEQY